MSGRAPALVRSEDGILVQIAPCEAGGWIACLPDEARGYRYFAAAPGESGDAAARREAVAFVAAARAWRPH